MYQLVPTYWITHINGGAVSNLDDFVAAIKNLPDNEYVRVKVVSFDNVPSVLSVKINNHYWPPLEVRNLFNVLLVKTCLDGAGQRESVWMEESADWRLDIVFRMYLNSCQYISFLFIQYALLLLALLQRDQVRHLALQLAQKIPVKSSVGLHFR